VKVRYTPRAFVDREAIFETINRRNPRAAQEVKAIIVKRIAQLGDAPVRHRMIAQLGVHALYLGRYPTIVYVPRRPR
jgi:plasmid stabilization system protein ParE